MLALNQLKWYNLMRIQVQRAAIAQLVGRIHGKDEVSGSNPDRGSKFHKLEQLQKAQIEIISKSILFFKILFASN